MVATAAAAYVGSTAWGLGLTRVGTGALWAAAGLSGAWLIGVSFVGGGCSNFNAASRGASGFLMGTTLAAMLLGHQYLTTPTAAIEPLRRAIRLMGLGLGTRAILALAGLWLATEGGAATSPAWLYPAMRWGMGLAGPSSAAFLAWRTAELRSTQSATGVLYAALGLVLFGELVSLMLSRGGAPIL
ncbi:hypothetical protein [Paludisphaera mucosa]|uniref:Uncharacterized protein n=1 Tax=Paludisphaera mucosa TaxID=3030827 RepID=A0ABT6FCR1_9BACT|nr:hypothetical protein [Paludisphaera mucosa]MDG3005378.1 hypothetical protein [Paludisphaera mucosa]